MRSTAAQSTNFFHLALLPGCGAIVAARLGSRRSAIAAGVLVGVATLTRQTWVIGIIPAAHAAWWWGGRRVGRALLVLVSTMLTVASIGLVVPFGPFWRWNFTGNGSVLALLVVVPAAVAWLMAISPRVLAERTVRPLAAYIDAHTNSRSSRTWSPSSTSTIGVWPACGRSRSTGSARLARGLSVVAGARRRIGAGRVAFER